MRECTQCGKCCINYSNGGLSASASEIEYWQHFKPHIYQYVSNSTIWVHPKTGEQLTLCPWLKQQNDGKYTCDIYFDRPEDCKFYPANIEDMLKDECEMLEPKDMQNVKQAQGKLQFLMADSWVSFE